MNSFKEGKKKAKFPRNFQGKVMDVFGVSKSNLHRINAIEPPPTGRFGGRSRNPYLIVHRSSPGGGKARPRGCAAINTESERRLSDAKARPQNQNQRQVSAREVAEGGRESRRGWIRRRAARARAHERERNLSFCSRCRWRRSFSSWGFHRVSRNTMAESSLERATIRVRFHCRQFD